MYSVVLVSVVQQKDSVIHYIHIFSMFIPIMVYYQIVNRVSCAIQYDLLLIYLRYTNVYLLILNS